MSIKDIIDAWTSKSSKTRPAKKKKKNWAETKRRRRKAANHSRKMQRLHDSTH